MPQADADLVSRMVARFGSIDEGGPMKYLKEAGYTLTPDWHWRPKPGVTGLGQMTREEFDCLLFLAHEWDFGGLST